MSALIQEKREGGVLCSALVGDNGLEPRNLNHIGQRAWNRLTPKQKRRIIKNRSQARKILDEINARKRSGACSPTDGTQRRRDENDPPATERQSRRSLE